MEKYINRFFAFLVELNGLYIMLFGSLLSLTLYYFFSINDLLKYAKPWAYFGLIYLLTPHFFYNKLEVSRLKFVPKNILKNIHDTRVNNRILHLGDSYFITKINSDISFIKKTWGYVYASTKIIFFTTFGSMLSSILVLLIVKPPHFQP
jgi:hypothetical protein